MSPHYPEESQELSADEMLRLRDEHRAVTGQQSAEVEVVLGALVAFANSPAKYARPEEALAALSTLAQQIETLRAENERLQLLTIIDPEPLDEYALAGLAAQPIHEDDAEMDAWLKRAKRAEAQRDRLAAELRAVQWSGYDFYGNRPCPRCGGEEPVHDEECSLASALRDIEQADGEARG